MKCLWAHTLHPPSLLISYYISTLLRPTKYLHYLLQHKQSRSLNRSLNSTQWPPFREATVVTLKTITPLSSSRGVITESDAPAESVETKKEKRKRRLGQGSCGCIVYGGRRSNKGPQLKQDAGGDVKIQILCSKYDWISVFSLCCSRVSITVRTSVHTSVRSFPD